MSTISEMIERAVSHTDYVTTSTVDELYDAWRASGRDAHYNIVVNTCDDRDALMFRLVPRVASSSDGDEYTGNALQIAIALAGLCTVVYVALGWFFS